MHELFQTCIVHLVRYSLNFASWQDRKSVARDLKLIYRAETQEMAEANLSEIEAKWDSKYPTISQSWRRNWERVTLLLSFPMKYGQLSTPRMQSRAYM